MAATVVDFLLEDLKQLLELNTTEKDKDQIETLHEDLQLIRTFLLDLAENYNEHEELKALVSRIKEVACEALDGLDSLVIDVMAGQQVAAFDNSFKLRSFRQGVKSIKTVIMNIYNKKLFGVGVPQVRNLSIENFSRAGGCSFSEEETVLGFDDEAAMIREQLVGVERRLEVISIVGMGGIGKTTLARKLYNDPYIIYHFFIRGWVTVSQKYQKKDLLHGILSSVGKKMDHLGDEELGEELFRTLKGKPYLIVLDDLWDAGAWTDIQMSFPQDNNGSRIMLTTRRTNLKIGLHSHLHHLRFLSQDESWDLLKIKIFQTESCPEVLVEVGKQISTKCQGLPLAIVVVAGLAKREKTQKWWNQIAKNITSCVGETSDILALSYEHLPLCLKPCFLYFGEFSEDAEISGWRLICLWIAEGFVNPMEQMSLEDVAECYLKDLVDRNLVLVSETKSKGGIKACRIHDLLHDLCLKKAAERNWLQQIGTFGSVTLANMKTFFYNYKLLKVKVLILSSVGLNDFPIQILCLVHLRYLELWIRKLDRLPSRIANLWNLEALCVGRSAYSKVVVPRTIWQMGKLRHLRISTKIEIERPCSSKDHPSKMNSLQTISSLSLSRSTKHVEEILARTPNLRKLVFQRDSLGHSGRPYQREDNSSFPNLVNLVHLETLKLTLSCIPPPSHLPPNLRKGNSFMW